jgi:hypothetical protein
MDDITTGTISQNYKFLLKEGDTWTYDTAGEWASSEGGIVAEDDQIDILVNREGDGNYTITLGAYDGSDGSYVNGQSSNRPTLDYNDQQVNGLDPSVDSSGSTYVINASVGMGPDYIIIENIYVYNSNGRGVISGAQYPNRGTNNTIRYMKVEKHWGDGIIINQSDGATVSYNEVTNVMDHQTWCTGTKDGTGIALSPYNDGSTVSYNYVHDSMGECIGDYGPQNYSGTGNIIEYNKAINCTIGIHAGGGKTTIRYNLVGFVDHGGDGVEPQWSSQTSAPYPNCETPKSAISIAGGYYQQQIDIYGNLVWGTQRTDNSCIGGYNDQAESGSVLNVRMYNNTMVDCAVCTKWNKYDNGNPGIPIDDGGDIYIYNNICTWYDDDNGIAAEANNLDYITDCDYNLWETVPADSDCDGANDPANVDAQLTKQSGWLWPTSLDTIDASDFVPVEGSPVIDAGLDLGANFDDTLVTADFTASPITATTGDQDDYGPPGQATLQAEPDGEDLNPTLETNAYVEPTAGAQSWDIGAYLASNDHLYTIWELDEDTVPGDDCTNGVDWVGGQASKSYTDLLSHSFVIEGEKTYCWRATFGNVVGDGTVSAVDQFTTTGSATGITITLSTTGNKKITGTISEFANKKVTLTVRP